MAAAQCAAMSMSDVGTHEAGLGRAAAIYLLTSAPFIISRHLTYKERNQQQPRRTRCAAVAAMTSGEPTLEIFCGPKRTA